MLEELGIVYSTFVHQGSNLMLEVNRKVKAHRIKNVFALKAASSSSVQVADWSGFENQLWSRTWDNCLENKATGKVLLGNIFWEALIKEG